MSKTKKLDIFNLFYSGAAVVILIGVIAKLLEWPAQDLLITGGLAIEAVVFGVSAIKFIEVKKESEVATEATLTKMAEGIGNLSSGVSIKGYGKTGVGLVNGGLGVNTSVDYFPNDNIHPNYTESSWKLLEQMDVLTLTKDLFYHSSWVNLKSEEYGQLTQLFKKLFNKKLPNKDALPFLIKFPVAFPITNVDELQLEGAHIVSLHELEILYKSISITGSNIFFETVVIEDSQKDIVIRSKKENEIQIFGGEPADVLAHAIKFHTANLIISPTQYYLLDTIGLKEDDLVKYLIEASNISDDQEIVSLASLLNNKSDENKVLFWSKFEIIKYDSKSGAGYLVLKAFVDSVIHFQNSNEGSNLLLKKIEIITDLNTTINRFDVIHFLDEVVYFGNDKEYNVKINELFSSEVLSNLKYFEAIVDKLALDEVSTKEGLLQMFNLNKEDSIEDLLSTLNRYLAKTSASPSGAQLSFVLLCKVFINS